MKEIPFNLNDYIKVKLTPLGIDILRKEREELNARIEAIGGKGFGEYEPNIDSEGYTKFQLWYFMERFGSHVGMAKPQVVETDIKILTDEE